MDGYWVFSGNAECASCAGVSGEYPERPGRPHENCACDIYYVPGDCEWYVSDSQGYPNGDGSFTFDVGVTIECPNGGGQSVDVTVTVEAGDVEIFDEVIMDAAAEAAYQACQECPPEPPNA